MNNSVDLFRIYFRNTFKVALLPPRSSLLAPPCSRRGAGVLTVPVPTAAQSSGKAKSDSAVSDGGNVPQRSASFDASNNVSAPASTLRVPLRACSTFA